MPRVIHRCGDLTRKPQQWIRPPLRRLKVAPILPLPWASPDRFDNLASELSFVWCEFIGKAPLCFPLKRPKDTMQFRAVAYAGYL
jgi:hypothetical protein